MLKTKTVEYRVCDWCGGTDTVRTYEFDYHYGPVRGHNYELDLCTFCQDQAYNKLQNGNVVDELDAKQEILLEWLANEDFCPLPGTDTAKRACGMHDDEPGGRCYGSSKQRIDCWKRALEISYIERKEKEAK